MAEQLTQQRVAFEDPFQNVPKVEVRFPDRKGVKTQIWEVALADLKLENRTYASPRGIGMTLGEAKAHVNDYFKSRNERLLPPYVLMEIAENLQYGSLFDSMIGHWYLADAEVERKNGKAHLKVDGKRHRIEDISEEVRHLDENLWPASKGREVTRRTYAYTNRSDGDYAVDVLFWYDGDADVHSDSRLADLDSDVRLRVGRRVV